jgi:hypothetical protein
LVCGHRQADISPLTNGPYEVVDLDCVHTPGCEESEWAPRETLRTSIRPLEYSLSSPVCSNGVATISTPGFVQCRELIYGLGSRRAFSLGLPYCHGNPNSLSYPGGGCSPCVLKLWCWLAQSSEGATAIPVRTDMCGIELTQSRSYPYVAFSGTETYDLRWLPCV